MAVPTTIYRRPLMPLLLILSLSCFVLAALSVNTGRLNLVALGLLFYVANTLWPDVGAL